MGDLNKVEKLTPFGKFCRTIGNLPSSYMESLTFEEQILWFCDFLQNKVIPTLNNNAECVEELQNLYIELKNFVDNYFDNLDVQEEINNKLNDMVEDGTMNELIAPYLQIFQNLLNEEKNQRQNADSNLQNQINSLASGSPLVASSISEMTDTTRVYVNTSDGHWYTYDGTNWVDRGVYLGDIISLENFTTMPRILKLKSKNVFDDLLWYESKTVNPSNTTIYNVLSRLTDSQYGDISEIVQIKQKDGTPIISNNDLIFNTLNLSNNIWHEYGLNGEFLRSKTGSATGFSDDAYYIVFVQFKNRLSHWNILVKDVKVHWINPYFTIPTFERNYSNNFFDYLEWIENKSINTTNIDTSKINIFNYNIGLTESSIANTSKPLKIKDENGNKLINIENLIIDNKNTDANVFFLFDVNGNLLSILKGSDEFNIPNTCYYIIFVHYTNINNTITIPEKKIEWLYQEPKIYEVGENKKYTNLMNLFKKLKNDKTEKIIKIYNGIYDIFSELGGENFINSIDTSISSAWDYWSTFVPENTHLIGIGNVKLVFNLTGSNLTPQIAGFLSCLNARGNTKIENINIECSNCRYAIHDETGYSNNFDNMYHIYKNVNAKFTQGNINGSPSGQAFACGFEVGNNYIFEDCKFETTKTTIESFSMHNRNVSNENVGSSILLKNCIMITPTNSTKGISFINLHTGQIQTINLVKIINSYINGDITLKNDGNDSNIYNSYQLEILNTKYDSIVVNDNMTNNLIPNIYN